jgi:hypothetical protein
MDLREIGWGVCVEWIHLAWDRDRWWACECGDEPSGSGPTEFVSYGLLSCTIRIVQYLLHM